MPANPDPRLAALESWTAKVLAASDLEWHEIAPEASVRRYFRVGRAGGSGERFVAADFPAGREAVERYVLFARRLRELGLNVPEVLASEPERGFLLLSDLGERRYLEVLDEHSVDRLYGDALGALVVLQLGVYTDSAFLPPYDAARLKAELALFVEWYLARHRGLELGAAEQAGLAQVFDFLVDAALEQPRVWVHRDYHARNLIFAPAHNPGILDFQDAVLGPVTYDLVSLLRDCYIAWPRARVEEWVKGYHDLCLQSGVPVCEDDERFLRWFDLMGVQRHLKAAGIFARLYHRDGRVDYLEALPRTLSYVQEVSTRYPELVPLAALLDRLEGEAA
jgi:aminoglycoside/choline kinase family phosphotransferase